MSRIALITGATGQDGKFLIQLLLEKNYTVHILRQPQALPDLENIQEFLSSVFLYYGDLTDSTSIYRVIGDVKPDEIYNLAAQSHVHVSFDTPEYTAQVNALGVLRLLEAIRILNPEIKFFQASTSEIFGNAPAPQNEHSIMNPQSPYAAAKKYAYDIVRIYREAYGIFACNGIMFNHESDNRGADFVTQKIAVGVARIKAEQDEILYLGNLDAKRDWSHAEDMMRGAWKILQHDNADDFVLASGISHTVREFVEAAFKHIGISIEWRGQGREEKGIDSVSGKTVVAIDSQFFRPLDVENLQGDYSKANKIVGWKPTKNLKDIVSEMVDAQLAKLK